MRSRTRPHVPNDRRVPIVSLFSGCGGMDLGFHQEGFSTILAVDKDEVTLRTYRRNHPHVPTLTADISTLTGAQILSKLNEIAPGVRPRGVIGGPPCQSFSRSNVHMKRRDPRHLLPFHYASILNVLNRAFDLDFFVFENVLGLTSSQHKHRFRKILRALDGAGFNSHIGDLDASWFGVPQLRRRVFVVGINKTLYPSLAFNFPPRPEPLVPATVRETITSLPAPRFFSAGLVPSKIPHHRNHWTMRPLSSKFGRREQRVRGSLHNAGRSFRKLRWNAPSPAVAYGHREIHLHPSGKRRLSIFEAMLLQGFPRRYVLLGNMTQQVKQVSDAVPPPMARAVAHSLRVSVFDHLNSLRKSLLDWSILNGRRFPWRRTRNPYFILLAEKLLQQTAARPHLVHIYGTLTRTYPNIGSLASGSVAGIRRLLSPLGLQYRARELVSLARYIVKDHNSLVPSELSKLLHLPGIGDYIARAVQSLAFGASVPMVDTNTSRLLHRLFGLAPPLPANPARNRRLRHLASNLLAANRSRDLNLAVIDLCAKVCTPSNPKCLACPLSAMCAFPNQGADWARSPLAYTRGS